MQEWLPEAYLARYVVDVDLSALERAYIGIGSNAYHSATLFSLRLRDRFTEPAPLAENAPWLSA